MTMDIDRHGPRLMPNNCKNLNPHYFSLPSTFKAEKNKNYLPLLFFMNNEQVEGLSNFRTNFLKASEYPGCTGRNIFPSVGSTAEWNTVSLNMAALWAKNWRVTAIIINVTLNLRKMAPSIGLNLRVTGYKHQGGRKYMEDEFGVAYQQTADEKDLEYAFFGIFDGHGGREAALFAKVSLEKF